MRYGDLVKPSTFADDNYFQELTSHMRKNDPLPFVETDSHKAFWVATRHSDIMEIERQHEKFLNTGQSVLQPREVERQIEESGQGCSHHRSRRLLCVISARLAAQNCFRNQFQDFSSAACCF